MTLQIMYQSRGKLQICRFIIISTIININIINIIKTFIASIIVISITLITLISLGISVSLHHEELLHFQLMSKDVLPTAQPMTGPSLSCRCIVLFGSSHRAPNLQKWSSFESLYCLLTIYANLSARR